jgi:hypothetical protein
MREILSSATLEKLACETRILQQATQTTGDGVAEVVG